MSEQRKRDRKKPARRQSAPAARPDPHAFRAREAERAEAWRRVCSLLGFWRACGHKTCLRRRACAHAAVECHERFWPLVPEALKHSLRAGLKARLAGLPLPEITGAIADARERWRETQMARDAVSSAPPPVAAADAPERRRPAPVMPRIRVL